MKRKSLNLGVFDPKNIAQASPYCGDEVFAKGLEKNGYHVTRFDYRSTNQANYDLVELIQTCPNSFDVVWIGKCERIYDTTIEFIRQLNPNALIIKWAADVRDKPTSHDLAHLRYVNLFVATYGGEYLKSHWKTMQLNQHAISMFTFTDSDFYKPMDVPNEWKSDVLWTGRSGFGDNEIRNEVIYSLSTSTKWNVKMFGLKDWIGYPEYLYAINGTKIGVGVNSFNRTKYSSDRLGNYMSCGTFYLTHYIEGIEEVFERGVHLDWFHTVDEMNEKINFYLKNDEIRKKIANAGRSFVLKYFDTNPLVRDILNVANNKKKINNWDVFY